VAQQRVIAIRIKLEFLFETVKTLAGTYPESDTRICPGTVLDPYLADKDGEANCDWSAGQPNFFPPDRFMLGLRLVGSFRNMEST